MPIQFNVIHIAEVDSTQDEALRRVQAGAPDFTVIMADVQLKGRGRHGRVWQSIGGNVQATLILRLQPTDQAGDISLLMGVVLHNALSTLLPRDALWALKWPNDILLNGVKCAGILIERPEPDILLIGFGVNVADAPPDRACLLQVLQSPPPARDVLDQILRSFDTWLGLYRAEGLAPVRAQWLQYAHGLNHPLIARLPREEIHGIFKGLDHTGALILMLEDGSTRLINSGEVFFA